jgi:Mn-containing catalase
VAERRSRLQADGLRPARLFDERPHDTPRSGTCPTARTAKTALGLRPSNGQHEFGYLAKPEPLGGAAAVPAPDPKLYATYNGAMGKPSGPALGTETGLAGKIKNTLT